MQHEREREREREKEREYDEWQDKTIYETK